MNWDLLGHEWAVQMLKEHIVSGSLRHAYLITGPAGAGRRTLALRFAQAINCPTPLSPGEPCRTCRTCQQIEQIKFPDLHLVQAEQAGGTLKVEQVREVQRSLSLAPYEGKYRLALFLRFEEAHTSAANALLKTLEEPSPQVILVLTTESPESLLPTVVSRCEQIRLRPAPISQIAARLQTEFNLPAEQASLLAHLSAGRPGYALQLHRNPDLLAQRQNWVEDQINLLAANRLERFIYAEKLVSGKQPLRDVLQVWLSFWRDLILRLNTASVPLVNLDRAGTIEQLAESISVDEARRVIGRLEKSFDLLDHNANPRLTMEVLLMDMPRVRVPA